MSHKLSFPLFLLLSLLFFLSLSHSFSSFLSLLLYHSPPFYLIHSFHSLSLSLSHIIFLSLFMTLWNATKTSLRGHHSLLSSSPSKKTPNNPPPTKKGPSDENELDVEEKWLEEFFYFLKKSVLTFICRQGDETLI